MLLWVELPLSVVAPVALTCRLAGSLDPRDVTDYRPTTESSGALLFSSSNIIYLELHGRTRPQIVHRWGIDGMSPTPAALGSKTSQQLACLLHSSAG